MEWGHWIGYALAEELLDPLIVWMVSKVAVATMLSHGEGIIDHFLVVVKRCSF